MHILYIILVLLIITRACGELAERLKQPALLGELVAGILLGLVVQAYGASLPELSGLKDDEVFIALTDLGIFFLMLYGGIELHPRKLVKASKIGVLVAVGGMLIPFGLGILLGWWQLPESDFLFAQCLFLGTALAITAVPVAIKVLLDLDLLESKIGQTVISAAVIDDVLSLVLLGVMTAVIQTGNVPVAIDLLLILAKVVVFFAICALLGKYLFPWIGRYLKFMKADEIEFSMLLVAALGYAMMAEFFGMHFIIGAFLAGLFFGRSTIDKDTFEKIEQKVRALTNGFFAPLFFASIGLHLDLGALVIIPWFVVMLIVVAAFGKVFGAGLLAWPLGFSFRESLALGNVMNARGAVELIVADIALRAGLFSHPSPVPPVVAQLFSAVVIMAVFTTLMTPVMLRLILPTGEQNRQKSK